MLNKILFIICIFLAVVYLSFPSKKTFILPEEEKIETIRVLLNDGNIETMSLNDYLIGVLSGEMPASFSLEALKAQSVASRTYAIYQKNNRHLDYDVKASISDQVYLTKEEMQNKWSNDYDNYYNKIKEAVNATNNLIMTSDGKVICSYFFAISNGYTESSQTVFGNSEDYLVPVESNWDKNVKNYEVTTNYSKQEFCDKLQITCNNINISNLIRNETNHITEITINNKTYTGVEIRKLLNLRSTDFTIQLNDTIDITTKGYGHDVGMSEYGANEMAKNGYNYQEILKYYYQNIEIVSL